VRVGCGGAPARNPSGENTRGVNRGTALRFSVRNEPPGRALESTNVARSHHLRPRRREPIRRGPRPGAMPTRRAPLLAGILLLVSACSGAASSPPGSTPSPTPVPSLGIEHATGATDVLLRYERGGGFMAPNSLVTEGPIFSLYRDGTIVFRDITASPPEAADGLGRGLPYRTARLSEPQIQALLQYAINDGVLGIARAQYLNNRVADAPTTVFTIHAGTLNKTVSVMALGIDAGDPGPDAPALNAMAKLAERLGNFNGGTGFETQAYMPDRYRALLLEAPMGGGPAPIAWPWPDIKPADFTAPADPEALSFPRRTLTAADVAKLKLDKIEGGLLGIPVRAPDGKVYTLALRPLLPDETG
jgi:hypothetical protein